MIAFTSNYRPVPKSNPGINSMKPEISLSPTGDPWLLTPGPLTTSLATKQAMMHDFGSRDHDFIEINRHMRERLVDIIGGGDEFACVPMQGSGTFAAEAMRLVSVVI